MKRKQRTLTFSNDTSAKFSLQDSEASITFSDLEEQPTPSMPPSQSSNFYHVLVRYEGELTRDRSLR